MSTEMIHGDFVGGSTLAFRCQDNALVCGILREKGEVRWHPGLQIEDFFDGVAVVFDPERQSYGAMNRQGDMVLKPQFASLTPFAGGRAFALDPELTLLDRTGAVLKRFGPGLQAEPFCEGLAVLREAPAWETGEEGRYGLVDDRGEFVIPLRYRWPGHQRPHEADGRRCSEGLVCVEVEGRYGFVDPSHQPAIPFLYEGGRRFGDGLAPVRQGGKWGYITRRQEPVLPFEWDDAQPFSEDLGAVERGGRWGFLDRSGTLIIPADFSEVSPFAGGHAVARTDFGCGLIDRAGQFFVPPIYDQVSHFHEGIARVELRGMRGVLDRSLAVLWDETVR